MHGMEAGYDTSIGRDSRGGPRNRVARCRPGTSAGRPGDSGHPAGAPQGSGRGLRAAMEQMTSAGARGCSWRSGGCSCRSQRLSAANSAADGVRNQLASAQRRAAGAQEQVGRPREPRCQVSATMPACSDQGSAPNRARGMVSEQLSRPATRGRRRRTRTCSGCSLRKGRSPTTSRPSRRAGRSLNQRLEDLERSLRPDEVRIRA